MDTFGHELHALARQHNMAALTRQYILANTSSTATGQKPPKMDPDQIRKSHRQCIQTLRGELPHETSVGTHAVKTYPSDKPVSSLKRTAIADVKINIPAKGFYLLLRTIEEPHAVNGITTVVEDHMGDVFLFTAYNLVSLELEKLPDRVLPIGTVFILKEPFLKTAIAGGFLLRTDSPSDVIILHKHHPLYDWGKDVTWKNSITRVGVPEPKTTEAWKKKGNKYFDREDYMSALNCYLNAARILREDKVQMKVFVYLNISVTYLHLYNYEFARDFAVKVLDLEPRNIKGLYRAGRANYELRQWDLAKKYFQQLLDVQPGHAEGMEELKRTLARLKEAGGSFNIEKLYNKSRKKPRTRIDCAGYVGPLKIVSSFEKRRSVQAVRDIEPGTVLVVAKALICVFQEPRSDLPYEVNLDNVISGEVAKAVKEACQLVHNNPKIFGTALYDLPVNDAILDVIRPKPFCDEDTNQETHVDVERIRKILTNNSVPIDDFYKAVGLVSGEPRSCGLFLFPSYFHHSCLANASWTTYNDVMVVHAIKHIKEGEEVTIAKIDPLSRYSLKQREFNRREIRCDCRLCESDLSISPPLRVRIEDLILIVEQLLKENVLNRTSNSTAFRENVVNTVYEIEELINGTGSKELQFYLAVPYLTLANAHAQVDRETTIRFLWKAIRFLGFDEDILDSWSNRNGVIPKDCLFSNAILGLIEFLVLNTAILGQELTYQKYMEALKFGSVIYKGASEKMVLDAIHEMPSLPPS